jgi:hypothetical protein
MKRNILIASGITLGLLGLFWVKGETTPPKANCINVYIDFGVLAKETPDSRCYAVSGKTNAVELLKRTTLKIDYIDFGGDLGKAVCTINKLPKLKSCAEMDWESYWGVFEKHGSNNLNASSHWNMSAKGLSFIELKPGDSIGLVYLDKGKVRYPDDNTNQN